MARLGSLDDPASVSILWQEFACIILWSRSCFKNYLSPQKNYFILNTAHLSQNKKVSFFPAAYLCQIYNMCCTLIVYDNNNQLYI